MRTSRLWVAVVVLVLLAIALALAVLYTTRPAPPPPEPAATTSWYTLHFTTPSYPDRPENHRGGVDEHLVAFVDSAQRSIDAAVYDFDLQNVAAALARAKQRGVQVRFVTDTDTWTSTNADVQAAWRIVKQAEIPVADDQKGAIMHHKFMVVDGQRVWTGSWNWTIGDTYRLNNHAIRIDSPELAANYAAEFERMFAQRQFGGAKRVGSGNPRLTIGGAQVESYFAPRDPIAQRIVDRVTSAVSAVDFLAFSFTDDKIGDAMLARHAAGVPVRGVFETTGSQTRFSELGRLRQAGLDVYPDASPYAMHHKVILVDNRTAIFGSYNFSSNAAEDNDENILLVDDPTLATAFAAEFTRLHTAAKQKRQ